MTCLLKNAAKTGGRMLIQHQDEKQTRGSHGLAVEFESLVNIVCIYFNHVHVAKDEMKNLFLFQAQGQ